MAESPHRHLPRLQDESYRGFQSVHWIMTIADRRQGWLNEQFQCSFRETLISAASQYHVVVPIYCIMPDHIHLLASGIGTTSDQKLWSRTIRRAINLTLKPLKLQRQAYDHVLRSEEKGQDSFPTLIHYIRENPQRSGLVADFQDWKYSGSVVPGLPDLHPATVDFHDRWWAYWKSAVE